MKQAILTISVFKGIHWCAIHTYFFLKKLVAPSPAFLMIFCQGIVPSQINALHTIRLAVDFEPQRI